MASALPRHYEVELDRAGWASAALLCDGQVPILGGSGATGDEAGWSPEQLLLSALGLCLMRSFDALAQREGVWVSDFHCRTEASVTMMRAGVGYRPGFTLVTVHAELAVAEADMQRARDLMVQAKQQCVVANALMPPVHLELSISAAAPIEPAGALTCR
jgi:organic hydroperoxide reductase OsmC/OhrA